MAGIKDIWGLKDPRPLPSSASDAGSLAPIREAFQQAMQRASASLRDVAADANQAALDKVQASRETAYQDYHQALSRGDDLDKAIQSAQRLEQQASALRKTTQAAKHKWEAREKLLTATQDAVANADQQGDQQAIEAQRLLVQALTAASEKQFDVACTTLVEAAKFAKDLSSAEAATEASPAEQETGPSSKYEQLAPSRNVLADLLDSGLSSKDAGARQLVYDQLGKHPATDARAFVDGLTLETVRDTTLLAEEMQHVLQRSSRGLEKTATGAVGAVQEKVQAAHGALDEMSAQTRAAGANANLVDDAESEIRQQLERINSHIDTWNKTTSERIAAAGSQVEASLQEFDRWSGEMGSALDKKSHAWAELPPNEVHERLVATAGDIDLPATLKRGVDQLADAKRDARGLIGATDREIAPAMARVEALYTTALEKAPGGPQPATPELDSVKDNLIDKLSATQRQARQSARELERRIDLAASQLSQSAQEILDKTGGVVDSLASVVDSGTDTLSNAMGSASEPAAERFNSMLNLLG